MGGDESLVEEEAMADLGHGFGCVVSSEFQADEAEEERWCWWCWWSWCV